jgi:peptidoglycan/xylan/chitin deacetylase (PgdA/CDA1 family)
VVVKKHLRCKLGKTMQLLGHTAGLMNFTASLYGIDGAIILMYHSVAEDSLTPFIDPSNHVPAEVFAEQLVFLARRRKIMSLADLVFTLKQGKYPCKGTVVITFDDGYLDNLTIAAPILNNYGLTATLFLPTAYIERSENQWIDQAYTSFKFRTRNQLIWGKTLPSLFDLKEPKEFKAGYRAVCKSLLSAPADQRRALLDELRDQLRPSANPPRLTMNWDEVRTLVSKYKCFEIGGHTLEHTDLTSVPHNKAKNELTACAQRIKDELGVRPRYFSFCYGRTSESLRELAFKAGFEAACGGEGLDPVIKAPADLFRLPRIEAPASMQRFDLLTSSANTGIWRRLGR